jgi:gliding motility-associated-like protein
VANDYKSKEYMRLFITGFIFAFYALSVFSQGSTTIGYTGSPQNYTVPPCTSSLSITLSGSSGGGPNGGAGAQLNLNIPVQPSDVVTFVIGQASTGVTGGYPNGGNGAASSTNGYSSYGGGGSSMVYINGVLVAVAGAGGGGGGGNTNASAANGGCVTGVGSATSPFGQGGGNGTQTTGGSAGPPWISSGNPGQPGSFLQGGSGASDPCYNLGPGGGGGGGYYGGGGGGSDCFSAGSLGGGAGGGGSSLVPPGSGCVDDVVTGNGSAVINSGLGVLASNTGPYCVGGTIQLNGSSGATTYSWTGPNGFTSNVQNPTIPNSTLAMAGTYSLTVTGTGCTDATTTDVVVLPPIAPNAGVDDTVCFGSPINLVGVLSVATDTKLWTYLATGITPTPTVQILPASNNLTPTVNVNQPGLYSFILTETNPVCGSKKDTVKIFVKQMTINQVTTNTSCAGFSDGTITLSGSQATQYSYDNGNTWSSVTPGTGFAAGTYNVCVRDNNLCQACTVATITDPAPIMMSVSNDTLICENGSATMTVSAIGGNSYDFHWDLFPTTAASQIGSPLVNTYYVVQAESDLGCFSNKDSIYVTIRPPLTGTITPDDTICPGYPTTLTATAAGGIGTPFNFVWSSGESGTGSNHTITANPPQTTQYTVTIDDACESTPIVLTTNVILAPLPVPLISVDLDNECEPAMFVLTNETDPLMNGQNYWLLSDGQYFQNQQTIVTDEMWSGLYDVQLVVTSPFGCIDSTTFINYLTVHPKPIADFRHSPNPAYMFNPTVHLTNYSVNGDSYEWFIQDGNPSFSQLEHVQTMFPDGLAGDYEVTLITTSEFGCIDTSTQIVIVLPEVLLYAPNTFTPDDDEFNQDWGVHISGIDIFNFELLIFNRWGQIIWESHDPAASWDGTFNGEYVQQGTYTWTIEAKDLVNDRKYEFNGFINVLK